MTTSFNPKRRQLAQTDVRLWRGELFMALTLSILERYGARLTRRRFIRSMAVSCAAVAAWAAGTRTALATCGPEPNCCGNVFQGCQPNCGGLYAVACCCLSYPTQCPNNQCCVGYSGTWCWYCVDCSSHTWECMECDACGCSAAIYIGRQPTAASSSEGGKAAA